jgi:SAM-dependent methyltransferase
MNILCLEHYNMIALHYDDVLGAYGQAQAKFIKRHIPLSKEDQLVDVGGGTAKISLQLHASVGMTKPVVCVDPSQEMLAVAQRNGAITIQATAEEFFSSKPDYPLKVVLMNGSAHLFSDLEFVFTKLAEYLPVNGVCFVAHISLGLPLFKAAAGVNTGKIDHLCQLVQSKGLKCQVVSATEPGETSKEVWYNALRNRVILKASRFTDKQLELGIQELEEKFKGEDVLHYEMSFKGFIITN